MTKKITTHVDAYGHEQTAVREGGRFADKAGALAAAGSGLGALDGAQDDRLATLRSLAPADGSDRHLLGEGVYFGEQPAAGAFTGFGAQSQTVLDAYGELLAIGRSDLVDAKVLPAAMHDGALSGDVDIYLVVAERDGVLWAGPDAERMRPAISKGSLQAARILSEFPADGEPDRNLRLAADVRGFLDADGSPVVDELDPLDHEELQSALYEADAISYHDFDLQDLDVDRWYGRFSGSAEMPLRLSRSGRGLAVNGTPLNEKHLVSSLDGDTDEMDGIRAEVALRRGE